MPRGPARKQPNKAIVAAALARKRAVEKRREEEAAERAAEKAREEAEAAEAAERRRLAEEARAAKLAANAAKPSRRKLSASQKKKAAKARANLARLKLASNTRALPSRAEKKEAPAQPRVSPQIQMQKQKQQQQQLAPRPPRAPASAGKGVAARGGGGSATSSPRVPPASESEFNLRAPVVAVLGHVDVGKTKLLDCLRKSDVQGGEAAGITQQIGATVFTQQHLVSVLTSIPKQTAGEEKATRSLLAHIPGLVIIDTPGHGMFKNMRKRGARICDVAIVVVDLMHGLERQTREVLGHLARSRTPFVVALNKVDRCYEWRSPTVAHEALCTPLHVSKKKQPEHTRAEFENRVQGVMDELQGLGLSCSLVGTSECATARDAVQAVINCGGDPDAEGEEDQDEDDDDDDDDDGDEMLAEWPVALVPTSAKSSEGIGELIEAVVLCAALRASKLRASKMVEAVVMEVKQSKGQPTTLDVILKNGTLHVNDDIALCGYNGPMLATIKRLQVPSAGLEMRLKKDHYTDCDAVSAATGVRITTKQKIDEAIAGTPLMFTGKKRADKDWCLDFLRPACRRNALWKFYDAKAHGALPALGVHVQAPTHGSLEAMLEWMAKQDPPVPVQSCAIGALNLNDVKKLGATLDPRRVDRLRDPVEDVAIIAFATRVPSACEKAARKLGIEIYADETVYRVMESFREGQEKLSALRLRELRQAEKERRKKEAEHERKLAAHMRKNNQRHKVDRAAEVGGSSSRRSDGGAGGGELRQTKNDWKKELERDGSNSAIAEEEEEEEEEGEDDGGGSGSDGNDEGSQGVPSSPGTPGLGLFVSAIKTPALDPQRAAGPGDDFNL